MLRKKLAETAPEAPAELPPTSSTNDALVQEALAIDDYVKAENKRLSEFLAPYRARAEEIDRILLARMLEQGMPSIKTDHGTAYKSTIVTPKIVDREAYLDLVMDNYETFGRGLLQVGAPQKAAFDEYVERRKQEISAYQEANGGALPNDVGILPAGVEISSFTRINIRRS